MQKTVLGIDTSTLTASVAVVRSSADQVRVLSGGESDVNTHSQQLLGLIERALADADTSLAELDGIAIGAGPGSFTGLRIGMATAKGLAFAADKPLWAVSSLAAMAQSVRAGAGPETASVDGMLLLPILDARRSEVFVGFYRLHEGRVHAVSPEIVVAPDALAEPLAKALAEAGCERALALGDGLDVYAERLRPVLDRSVQVWSEGGRTPPAAAVAELALADGQDDVLAHGAPSYIRLSEAEIKYPHGNPGGAFKTRR